MRRAVGGEEDPDTAGDDTLDLGLGRRGGHRAEQAVLENAHRGQFEELAGRCGAEETRISDFKRLAVRAAHKLAQGDTRFGVLLDGRHGMRALEAAADLPYWIGRPIELPQSCPLEFDAELRDVGAEIAQWPLNHTVKCLAHYHPDDAAELRERQERQVLRLFDACRATRHELLLEIIASKNGEMNAMTTARAVQRFYDLGVRPDWWKLEPAADVETWRNIERAILANDRHCRGVVLLGLDAPQEDLEAAFAATANAPVVKGFAVGRTIFADAAEKWLSGKLSDDQAVADMAGRFEKLTEAWLAARGRKAA